MKTCKTYREHKKEALKDPMATSSKSSKIRQAQLGGILILLAGVFILMGIITAEAMYPSYLHYSTRDNEISDLGATAPPHSIITQPSAHIFDFTMILTGLMIIIGSICLYKAANHKLFTLFALLLGLGVLGVGVFPQTHFRLHTLSSMVAFLFGGLVAALSYRAATGAFRYVALLLGLTTLFVLFIGTAVLANVLGDGLERWIAYPVVLWMVCYGGYTLGKNQE